MLVPFENYDVECILLFQITGKESSDAHCQEKRTSRLSPPVAETSSKKMHLRVNSGLRMQEMLESLRPHSYKRNTTGGSQPSLRKRSGSVSGVPAAGPKRRKLGPRSVTAGDEKDVEDQCPKNATRKKARRTRSAEERPSPLVDDDVVVLGDEKLSFGACFVKIEKLSPVTVDAIAGAGASVRHNNNNNHQQQLVVPVGPGSGENCRSVESGYDSDETIASASSNSSLSLSLSSVSGLSNGHVRLGSVPVSPPRRRPNSSLVRPRHPLEEEPVEDVDVLQRRLVLFHLHKFHFHISIVFSKTVR
jgi:hypothetical protein